MHANGTLAEDGSYANGKRQGSFLYFDDDGQFIYQALFINDEEVWRSSDRAAKPDLAEIQRERRVQIDTELAPTPDSTPLPQFASLDRTTPLDRIGAQLGFGGPESLSFGSVKRTELFGNYSRGAIGGYGQYSQTSLVTVDGFELDGRRTLEGGATYQLPPTRAGLVTTRLGVLLPISSDDGNGFIASTAGAFQRPADGATSMPLTVAVRTSANLTTTRRLFVLQADVGVDWLMGGQSNAFDGLARANLGAGFGRRSAMLSVEFSNSFLISDPSRGLHAAGVAAGAGYMGGWASLLLSHCLAGDTALTAAVSYAL